MKPYSMALAFALGITLLEGSNVSAQNRGQVQNTRYDSMQDMIERSQSLEGTLVGYNSSANYCECDVQCGNGCAKCCNDRSAIYFGAELVVAKPHFEDEFNINSTSEARYDYDVSPRFIGGFSNANGLGGRVRYWLWDHHSNPGPSVEAPFRLYVQALDLETTMLARLGSADLMLFGGTRYGRVEHKDNDDEGMTFEGFGPTLGVDLMLPIRCSNLSLLAGIRYSALFGHTRFTGDDDDPGRGEDDLVTGLDTQLGVQYSCCVANGSLNVRAFVESQLWADGTKNPTTSLDSAGSSDEDLGFLAYVFGIEYVR